MENACGYDRLFWNLKSGSNLQIPLLLGGQNKRFSVECPNVEAFAARLDNFSRGVLSMLAKDNGCRDIVVAGGSALSALTGSTHRRDAGRSTRTSV